MKAKILNHGGYGQLKEIEFPVYVDVDFGCIDDELKMVDVKGSKLVKVGADVNPDEVFTFYLESKTDDAVEAEVIE